MQQHLQAIVTVLSLVNPLICGAMFAQIETGATSAPRLADATKAAGAVLVILVVAALVGARVLQVFGVSLDEEIAGQVLRLGLAPFFAPEAEQSGLIAAHDNPSVRATNKVAAVNGMPSFRGIIKHCVLRCFAYRSRGGSPSGSGLAVRMELAAEFRFREPS
jgi:hypothetical protein